MTNFPWDNICIPAVFTSEGCTGEMVETKRLLDSWTPAKAMIVCAYGEFHKCNIVHEGSVYMKNLCVMCNARCVDIFVSDGLPAYY